MILQHDDDPGHRGKSWAALFLVTIALAGCVEPGERERVAAGLVVTELSEGDFSFVATARASENAIQKSSIAMKRTTCLEGARLLIANGLRERSLRPSNLRNDGSTFLRDSEYCRTAATYFARGIPEEPAAKDRKVEGPKGSQS